MKKLMVIGVVGFVVSLAAATGLGIMLRKAPGEETVSDHAVAVDVQQTDENGPFKRPPVLEAPTRGEFTLPTSGTEPGPDPVSAPEDSVDLPPAVVERPVDPAGTIEALPAKETEEQGAETGNTEKPQYRQFAKILASMKASQAAEIMAYLSDEQAEGILRSLGVRQVAALLAAMPIERAAALSKRLLENPTEEE